MPRKSTPSPLAQRIEELGIEPPELAAICRVSLETVEEWIENGPDAEGAILTRFLADDATARYVERVRNTRTQNLKGDDWQSANVTVPYGGGFAGDDARSPE